MKSCFFIGHREAGSELRAALDAEIERHIALGVTQFYVGSYGGFDRLAARALVDAKARHPQIRLHQLLAYHPAQYSVPMFEGFDESYYPFDEKEPPKRVAIVKANEKMVRTCDYLIAYVCHPASNARNLMELAEKTKIHVTNLCDF